MKLVIRESSRVSPLIPVSRSAAASAVQFRGWVPTNTTEFFDMKTVKDVTIQRLETVSKRDTDYKVIDDTSFDASTPDTVADIINTARAAGHRLKIHYGDAATGQAWGDTHIGYIGRSVGPLKVPICLHDSRSIGGYPIMGGCIVKIEFSNKKDGGALYTHPTFKEVKQ